MQSSPSPLSDTRSASGRIYWMDAVRALCVILVTVNHAMNRSILLDSDAISRPGLSGFLVSLLYISTHLSIPMFLMLSGALLLDRDYGSAEVRSRFYRHNWLRLLIAALIWLTIRFLVIYLELEGYATQPLRKTILDYLQRILLLDRFNMGPMWYLAMILCLYPLIPLLAAAIKRLPGRAFLLPGAVVLCFSILVPNLLTLLKGLGMQRKLYLAVLPEYLYSYYLLYLVWGHYAAKGLPFKVSTPLLCAVFGVTVLGTAFFQQWSFGAVNGYMVRNADLGIVLGAVCLFELLRRLAQRPRLPGPAVRSLARHSLGIFFVHNIIMHILAHFQQQHLPGFTGLGCFVLMEAAGLLGGWLFVWLTAKIPFVSKYLYLTPKPRP